jgi:hypothetical protein
MVPRLVLAAVLSVGMLFALAMPSVGQDDFRRGGTAPRTNDRYRTPPVLSEATAILESNVRDLYQLIEPDRNTSPNELIAYADLRALRLYTGALEVAGWDFEQAAAAYQELDASRYRGRVRTPPTDARVIEARDRYLAYRETLRTLLYRVRSISANVEHQISFCDRDLIRGYQRSVFPALQDVIAATQPYLMEDDAIARYGIPGQTTPTRVIPTAGSGIPQNAVEVSRNRNYKPYEGKARGYGRYFEIRAYGGSVRVKSIRFVMHESAFGSIYTGRDRELTVDQVATPQQPLRIPCNRGRSADISEVEVEWEQADNRRSYATIDVIEDDVQN